MGAADARRPGRLPAPGAGVRSGRPGAGLLAARARSCSRCGGRSGSCSAGTSRDAGSAPGCRRCATGCRPTCATARRARTSTRCRSRSLYLTRRRVGRGDRQPDRARRDAPGLGPGRRRRLPRPDGRAGEAERGARARRTWPRSRRSGTWSSTRRCCATSGAVARGGRRVSCPPASTRWTGSRVSAPTFPPAAARAPRSRDRIGGAVSEPFAVPLAELGDLPRRELDRRLPLRGGVVGHRPALGGRGLRDLLPPVIEPQLRAGRDGHPRRLRGSGRLPVDRAIEDALADDVLIAEHLDGAPLDGDHGAPVRLVSPSQYGFISTKHLCRIELHTAPSRRSAYHRMAQPARPASGRAPPARAGVAGGAPSPAPRLGAAGPSTAADPADQRSGRPRRPGSNGGVGAVGKVNGRRLDPA